MHVNIVRRLGVHESSYLLDSKITQERASLPLLQFLFFIEMAEAIIGFTMAKPHIFNPSLPTPKMDHMSLFSKSFRMCSSSTRLSQLVSSSSMKSKRGSLCKVNVLPDLHCLPSLMAVLVEHIEGQRDLITHKSIFHLNDTTIKKVYAMYIMFTVWGCFFFGSMKDPYYDGEVYRGDGGDGSGNWIYEKQMDIEESSRAALWREELIEEIEQKVGSLRELEEAGNKEKEQELVN